MANGTCDIDHLAEVGYVPEYSVWELDRQNKNEIEDRLAKEMLKGSTAKFSYDSKKGRVLKLMKAPSARL